MKLDSAVLYTRDIDKAIQFYEGVIGLKVDYVGAGKFASFWFENARLSIKKGVGEREVPGIQMFYLSTENIEEDYKKMENKKVEFIKYREERPWGKEFGVSDPDNNRVKFIQRNK